MQGADDAQGEDINYSDKLKLNYKIYIPDKEVIRGTGR